MLRKIIEKGISSLKKKNFKLDKNIPLSYIFTLCISKLSSFIWAILRFRTIKLIFIHYTSVIRCKSKMKIEIGLNIERNCYIDALSINGLILGKNITIGKNTCIECTGNLNKVGLGITIEDNVSLGTHGFYGGVGGVYIGENTIFGNYVSVHPENHIYSDVNIPIKLQGVSSKGIFIGKNCWIGSKVTILDGSHVGNHCVIAAGAVVRGHFPDNCIIGGIPAKIIKHI